VTTVRQILVPLDGSPLAEKVLPAVRRLALATNGTVHLVRVVPPASAGRLLRSAAWYGWGGIPLEETAEQIDDAGLREADDYLEAVRRQLAGSGIVPRVSCLRGDIASALLDYERDMGIDLVVLSTQGHGGLARFALESTAARLLRHGEAPILLANAARPLPSFQTAVLPLDGSAEHEGAIGAVAMLAPGLLDSVSLLRVVATSDEEAKATLYLNQVADRLLEQGIDVAERRVNTGHAVAAVRSMAGSGALVVMATHAHAGPGHRLFTSLVDRLVRDQTTSLLLVRVGDSRHEDDGPEQVVSLARYRAHARLRVCPNKDENPTSATAWTR
jgi:nucleotide-binding universal stress UspA family protein